MKKRRPRGRDYVDDVGEVFRDYAYEDGRECIAGDLANLGAEEAARQFRKTEELLRGLLYTADDALGWGAVMVLGDAKQLAREAAERAEKYAERTDNE